MDTHELPAIGDDKGEWDAEALSRRRFLETSIKAMTALAGSGVAAAGAVFLAGKAFETPIGAWVQVGPVAELVPGLVHRANFSLRGKDGWRNAERKGVVYVQSEDGNTYTAFDATCTHLGCIVRWVEADQQFGCPCHAGYFQKDGTVGGGPPPRALRRLATKIEEGVLWAEV